MTVKQAHLKDSAFLASVKKVLASGRLGIWWLGQSGFLVACGGRAIIFDPYLSDSLSRKYEGTDKPHTRVTERVVDPHALGALGVIDAITSSHNHTDHLDAETLLPLLSANPRAKFIVPAANRDFIVQRLGKTVESALVELDHLVTAKVAEFEFTGIAAAHNTVERDEAGRCKFLGYVAKIGNKLLYHSGDTLRYQGMADALLPFHVDTALLPINGDRPERRVAGNLDGPAAAQLARDIGAKLVIPCHFDMFEFNTATPEPFIEACVQLNQPFKLLRNGEGLEL